MSDDLVKRLHWHHNFIGTNPWSDGYPFLKEVRDRLGEAADRIEALTAERDRAYANGYSDAETEISRSALGQRNAFLHSQYANAADRIEQLAAELSACTDSPGGCGYWRERSKALTADFARQVQRTDEQREAYEQALSVMEADNERLQSLLAHAASDLTAYVDAEYPPDTCAQYPDIARRHHRDMDLVRRIEAALKGEGNE